MKRALLLLVGCGEVLLPPVLSAEVQPPHLAVSALTVQVGTPLILSLTGQVTVRSSRRGRVTYTSRLPLCWRSGVQEADAASLSVCTLLKNTPSAAVQVDGTLYDDPTQITADPGETRTLTHSARLTFTAPGTYTLYGFQDVDVTGGVGGSRTFVRAVVPEAVHVTVTP